MARRFYIDGASRIDLADEFGMSRFKVARMLDMAVETGVVTITIHDQSSLDTDLSERVAAHLGLHEVVVINAFGRPEDVRRQVGAAAAQHLSAELEPGEVVGLAWGRSIAAMTEALTSLPKVTVVQLTGTVGSELTQSPVEMVRRMADRSGGAARPIFSPMLVDDARTAEALRRQTDLAGAMALFDQITTAVLAVGSWDPPLSQLRDVATDAEREELLAKGVRGEVAGILFDDQGNIVAPEFTDRMVTIHVDQLRRIPRVIGVVSDERKARAVVGVARAHLVTSLVMDRALAEAILALDPVPADARRS